MSGVSGVCRLYSNVVEAMELPVVVHLRQNLFAAAFRLMKLLPARFILDQAEREGLVTPDTTIIETTSGTFGLALALVCALRHYRLILVSDPAVDDALQRRLEDLGAEVEIVRDPAAIGGFQRARLERMEQLQARLPQHFWPSQYDNQHNPGAYSRAAEALVQAIGHIDCLIGPVGSGGSMCGTSRYLRDLFPDLYAVAVDTHGSILFGQPDSKRMLRGLGNSLMPRNLDHTAFDEVHWVSAAEAYACARQLHRLHGLYMGGTSGAAFLVAQWWAAQHPNENTVVLLPDEGYRYQETIYDDTWLETNGLALAALPVAPQAVTHPEEAETQWAFLHWDRRTYEQVTGRV